MSDERLTGNKPAGGQRHPVLRAVLFWVGVLLIVMAPLVGVIPGPGGVFFFAAGAALVLRNSRWAKRHYARLKRRHPNKGAWADWSLRRSSYLRRTERDKVEQEIQTGCSEAPVIDLRKERA